MSEKDPPPSAPKPAPRADDSVDELFSAVSSAKQKERTKDATPARLDSTPTTPGPGGAGPGKKVWLIVAGVAVLGVLAWGVSKLGGSTKSTTASTPVTTSDSSPTVPVSEPPRTPVERQMNAPSSGGYRSSTPPAFIDSRRNDPRPVPPPPPPPPADDRDRADPPQDEVPHEEAYPGQDPAPPPVDEGAEAQPPQEN